MLQLHDILDLNPNSLSSRDISKTSSEHIIRLLFQQTRWLMLCDGGLEGGTGLLLLLNRTLDKTCTDVTSEGHDGGGFVQRESVFSAGNWKGGGRVDECLGDGCAGCGVVEFSDGG
jgi:hypothetical protein